MKRCTRCILPENYPGVVFNEQGICNNCLDHVIIKRKVKGKEHLINIINSFKNKEKYDCIVTLSGGRDSTFVAYYAVNNLGLKPLAVTVDNDFMPEQTKINIKETVERLGLDHHVVSFDYVKNNVRHVLSSLINKPAPAMVALLCTGCTTGIKSGVIKVAREHNLPLILEGGGGEPTVAKFAISFAQQLMSSSSNPKWQKITLLVGFLRNILNNPRFLSSPEFIKTVFIEYYYRFLFKMTSDLRNEKLFDFIDWDEEEICSTIENKLNWKKPDISPTSWRSDCKIHLVKQYLYREMLGFTKNDDILSGMVREKSLTRDEALKRIEHENEISQKFLTEFLSSIGLELDQLNNALEQYKHNYRKTP